MTTMLLYLLCLFPLLVNSISPYGSCPYSDSSTYGSVYNPGLAGPLSAVTYANSVLGPNATFCECVSGYSDYTASGVCSPLFNSTYPLNTVDPLNQSPAVTLLYNSLTPQLLGDVFSFQLQSTFVTGRNISWSFSALAPSYVPSSTSTGNSWTLSGANDVRCRRPGIYDVSGLDGVNRGVDQVVAAMDFNTVAGNYQNGLSNCGWSSQVVGNQYINKVLLTVQYADPIPNSNGLVRQSVQTYPVQLTSPRTVTVSSSAVTINAAVTLTAAVIGSFYSPTNNTLTVILQTSVVYPWQLSVVGNSSIPSTFTFSNTPKWVVNDIGMCPQNVANSTCTQQFILTAIPNQASICPTSSPQQGTLNGIYGIIFAVTPRGSSNSSSPNASVNTTITTDNTCKSVQLGVTTTVGLTPYADAAFSSMPSSTGFIQGSRSYWQILAQSTQVSVVSIRVNQIWYQQGSSFATTGLSNTNINYTTGSSNVAYPSTGTSYPTVRMIWDLQDASNCQNGASNYPLTPNAPTAAGVTLATCNPFSSAGAGVVQPGWLNAPSSTPEILYPNGYTLLATNNQFSITHMQAGSGQFSNGVSQATASFSYANSIKFTSSALANQGPATQYTGAPDYSSCTPSTPNTDPCQKYMYFQPANTYSPYSFATSITIFYGGMNATTSMKKRNLVITSDGKVQGNDDHLFVLKNTRADDPLPPLTRKLIKRDTQQQASNPALLGGQIIVVSNNNTDSTILINQQIQQFRDSLTDVNGNPTFLGVVVCIFVMVATVTFAVICVYFCLKCLRQRSYARVAPV